MKRNSKYVVHYRPRKRTAKKRNRQFGEKFDPFKGSRLGYLTKKLKKIASFGRTVLRQAFK